MASDLGGFAPALIDAIARLCAALERAHIQYAIIGGIAVGTRSRPRATNDVDVLLSIPQLQLPRLLQDLIARGFTLDERKAIQEFVQHHITSFDFQGVRIDWLKPVVPMYQHVLDRARETPRFWQTSPCCDRGGADPSEINGIPPSGRGRYCRIAFVQSRPARSYLD